MPPKKAKTAGTKRRSSSNNTNTSAPTIAIATATATSNTATLPSAGLLLTCDPPTKQFIKRLDDLKTNDKKFVIEDLDSTHLLVTEKARDEILRKVEDWMNEVSNGLI